MIQWIYTMMIILLATPVMTNAIQNPTQEDDLPCSCGKAAPKKSQKKR